MDCSNSSDKTKLLDDSDKRKDEKKSESQWKNFTSKFSTNTNSFPEKQNYKRF